MLQGLRSFPYEVQLRSLDPDPQPNLLGSSFLDYAMSRINNRIDDPIVHVQSVMGFGFKKSDAPITIGRTMFETDRIPDDWVNNCNQMTEIWVPSQFNVQTFTRSGVVPDKLQVVPEPFDFDLFRPFGSKIEFSELDVKPGGFVFLSIFTWSYRKGWDLLIRAFIEEFSPSENVSLLIKTSRVSPSDAPERDIEGLIRLSGLSPRIVASRIRVIERPMTEQELRQLYGACDAFVLPTRGEGWGRPFVEAMAMNLPVIGTRWGGNTEFMDDTNSYLIDIDGLEEIDSRMKFDHFRGHQWAVPSITSLRNLMREVYENPTMAKQRAVSARHHLESRLSPNSVASVVHKRITALIDQMLR